MRVPLDAFGRCSAKNFSSGVDESHVPRRSSGVRSQNPHRLHAARLASRTLFTRVFGLASAEALDEHDWAKLEKGGGGDGGHFDDCNRCRVTCDVH